MPGADAVSALPSSSAAVDRQYFVEPSKSFPRAGGLGPSKIPRGMFLIETDGRSVSD